MFRQVSRYVRQRRAKQIENNRAKAIEAFNAAKVRRDTRDQHTTQREIVRLTWLALKAEAGQ